MMTDHQDSSPVLLTGGKHFQTRHFSWHRRLLRPWGMLLSLNDGGRISVGNSSYDIPAGALLVYKPDVLCKFTVLKDWEYLWFHFPLRSHMIGQLDHEEILPGVGTTVLEGEVLKTVTAELNEAYELEKIRRPGWETLAQLLIESALQRFSYYQEHRDRRCHNRLEKAIAMLTADKCGRIGSVAAACGMSEPLLYSLFRREMGCSPRQYREQFLLRKGKNLLINSDKGIDEIAEACEMCDRYYFSNRFKKLFGISPAAFRKSVSPLKTREDSIRSDR